ncbi:MAG: phosphate ABC transporter permease subunit PstC, partial [Acidimicrobiia bacterium]
MVVDGGVLSRAGGDPGAGDEDIKFRPATRLTSGDRVFRAMATVATSFSLFIVGLTFVFLLQESRPALESSGIWNFFTTSIWNPTVGNFGVLGLIEGTLIISVIAMIIGLPLAVAMALFINEYAPAAIGKILTSIIDLLAALPSLLFALWGFEALQPHLVPVAKFLTDHFSALPFLELSRSTANLSQSSFVVGVVVGIMILPIITSVSRDVMAQVPREQCEGALALGGTRWGMIREVILPYGRNGIMGAALLGFGRALGETIAVAYIISLVFDANTHILERGGGSIAALIAVRFGEAGSLERSALIGAGLALFMLTLVVSLIARRI